MGKFYRRIAKDGSISNVCKIDKHLAYDIFNYCPYCNTYSYYAWENTLGAYSSSCYCCGYHNSKLIEKEEIDLEYESFILISDKAQQYREQSKWYIAEIIPPSGRDNKAKIIEIDSIKYNQMVLDENTYKVFNELNIAKKFSLIKQIPNEHKIEVIDGLYKGLIIDMRYLCWIYTNHFEELNPTNEEIIEFEEIFKNIQKNKNDNNTKEEEIPF